MTELLSRAEAVAPPVPAPRSRRLLPAILPWLFPSAALVASLHGTATPDREIALYAVYFALAVVLPGTLVFRALVGSRGNLPEDLGLGAATGLVTLLLGWALAAATGLQTLLPGWPLLLIGLFLAVPGLRRHWRPADSRPLPLRWSWLIAAGLVVVVLMCLRFWAGTPLPSGTEASYYQDLLYHLALVHEMTRSMPFQVPQLAGDTLRYHYLADADMAAASMVTRIAPATVLLRLWLAPIVGVTVLVVAALGRDLTGKWWAGALAGVASVVAMPLALGAVTNGFAGGPIITLSPSQTYALPLFGLLIVLAVRILRGRPLGWGWLLVLPVALACAGAKSSVLPPFVAGSVLAVLVVARLDRARLRAALGLLGLTLAAMLVGLKVFAGGGAGTLGVQPLALLYLVPPYRQTLGADDQIDGSLVLPHGVAAASGPGIVFLVGLLGWWALIHANHLLGLASLGIRGGRRDPVVWLLTGMTVAGTGAAWLFWHPSASQGYFYVGIIPFATLLTVWFVADRVRDRRPAVAGLPAGLIWAVVAPAVAAPAVPGFRTWAWALALPVLRTAVVAVVVGVAGLVAWRLIAHRWAGWRSLGVAALAAVLGAALGAGVEQQVRGSWNAVHDPVPAGLPASRITAAEMSATAWLDRHAGPDDVVATNVHCLMITRRSDCDARAFWVAGLGGRRTLIESWGYSDPVFPEDGVGGRRYYRQPAPYPQLYALNQRVFATATPADVARLRDGYHVRWLFADRRVPGGVTARLATVATARYTAGSVTVYELA
jgi:hypothetical protein